MEKFPLRMKDNDLLVTELFRDPNGDAITALSVYLTPRTCKLIYYKLILAPLNTDNENEVYLFLGGHYNCACDIGFASLSPLVVLNSPVM